MPADTGRHVPEPLNYVDGDWTSPSAPGQEVVDPATGKTLATVGFNTTDDVDPVSALVTEAIFGPVLGALPVADVDAGIDLLNGSDCGNAASLFTESGRETREFRRRAEAGDLAVNAGTAAPMVFFHFGGRTDPAFGDLRARSEDAVRFYTDETVYVECWPEEG